MSYLDKIFHVSKGFVRAYPFFIPFCSLLIGLIFQIKLGIFFCFYSYSFDLLNHLFKKITKEKIYKNKDYLPLLGYGTRPEGASHTGIFVKENCDGLSTSFGMPSGHSQMAMLAFAFWTLYLLDNYGYNNRNYLSIGIVFLMSLSVLISRVLLNCHTIQQVLVGGTMGLIFGIIGYYIYKRLIE